MTNSLTSDERDQQLKQIRERQARCARPDRDDVPQRAADPLARALSRELRQAQVDRAFLLSLIDSQAASSISHCALCEDPSFIYRDCVLAARTNATTAIRTACVEKVREYLTDCRDEERGVVEAIAGELESLRVEQKES